MPPSDISTCVTSPTHTIGLSELLRLPQFDFSRIFYDTMHMDLEKGTLGRTLACLFSSNQSNPKIIQRILNKDEQTLIDKYVRLFPFNRTDTPIPRLTTGFNPHVGVDKTWSTGLLNDQKEGHLSQSTLEQAPSRSFSPP